MAIAINTIHNPTLEELGLENLGKLVTKYFNNGKHYLKYIQELTTYFLGVQQLKQELEVLVMDEFYNNSDKVTRQTIRKAIYAKHGLTIKQGSKVYLLS